MNAGIASSLCVGLSIALCILLLGIAAWCWRGNRGREEKSKEAWEVSDQLGDLKQKLSMDVVDDINISRIYLASEEEIERQLEESTSAPKSPRRRPSLLEFAAPVPAMPQSTGTEKAFSADGLDGADVILAVQSSSSGSTAASLELSSDSNGSRSAFYMEERPMALSRQGMSQPSASGLQSLLRKLSDSLDRTMPGQVGSAITRSLSGSSLPWNSQRSATDDSYPREGQGFN
jgi:hypothetical protein